MDASLPSRQTGAAVWDAASPSIVDRSWAHRLGPDELGVLGSAAATVVSRSASADALDLEAVSAVAGTLRESCIGDRMRAVARSVLDGGLGFALLRGVPVREWGRSRSAAAFLLLSRLLGPLRPQNAAGHALGHVRDLGLRSTDPGVRIYQTHERQTFHTDSCDVVALLCLARALRGGASALVSVGAMYNRVLAARPDLLPALLGPIATDRRGEVPAGAAPFFSIPVLPFHDGSLSAVYQRQYIDSAQRFPGAPRLSPAHVEALDLWDALANDPAMQCRMELEPGDVQFVHNHALLHDRDAFEDGEGHRRHLLRAWVAADGARPLPDSFVERWGSVVVGARGGVGLDAGRPACAPLYAEGETPGESDGARSVNLSQ